MVDTVKKYDPALTQVKTMTLHVHVLLLPRNTRMAQDNFPVDHFGKGFVVIDVQHSAGNDLFSKGLLVDISWTVFL